MSAHKNKKGQLFSIDASLSLIVFILILLFLLVIWNLYSARLEKRVQEEEMQLVAMQALDILTKTWGVPNDWELKPPINPDPPTNNPQVLGLQLNPGSLDTVTSVIVSVGGIVGLVFGQSIPWQISTAALGGGIVYRGYIALSGQRPLTNLYERLHKRVKPYRNSKG